MFFCGGLVRLVAGRPCRCGIHRGAWRFWSPPYLPLALFLAPYPPDPLPQWGRGRFLLYFAGGFAPGTPALNRLRHLQNLPSRYPAGCLPSLPPAYPAFSLLYCPHPPDPLPGGKGETQSLFRRGLRPRHPCIRPFAALIVPAMRAPHARSLRFAAKTTGSGSLWAVAAAKERGDRGRGTSAFEMVLSPGAGIASAAQGQAPPLSTTAAGRTSAAGGLMPGCRGRSPRRNKLMVSPFPGGEGGRGDGGKKIN